MVFLAAPRSSLQEWWSLAAGGGAGEQGRATEGGGAPAGYD